MQHLFDSVQLDNGLKIEFVDETVRYYGDYHRVKIEVFIILSDGRRERFQSLERMAVSGAELDAVKSQVLQAFRSRTMKYMAAPAFEEKFIQNLRQRRRAALVAR